MRQERERLYHQQQPVPTAPPMEVQSYQAPRPTAPPMDTPAVNPVVIPTAPPAIDHADAVVDQAQVGECFCGDGVLPNDAFVLNCPCKNSFYHKDCIRNWVTQSKKCPTCRAIVTLADIMRKDFSQSAVVETQPALIPNSEVQPTPPSVTEPTTVLAAPQPLPAVTVQIDADRECYFCMEVDGDCTTANCDCTVKKAACRECLQEWLDAHHTCPRCQKEGATLITL